MNASDFRHVGQQRPRIRHGRVAILQDEADVPGDVVDVRNLRAEMTSNDRLKNAYHDLLAPRVGMWRDEMRISK